MIRDHRMRIIHSRGFNPSFAPTEHLKVSWIVDGEAEEEELESGITPNGGGSHLGIWIEITPETTHEHLSTFASVVCRRMCGLENAGHSEDGGTQ